jgi:hypothetical protein
MNLLKNHRATIIQVAWILEIAVGILPAALLTLCGFLICVIGVASIVFGDQLAKDSPCLLVYLLPALGGILGITAILMATNPVRLRDSARLRRRACWFALGGLCAEVVLVPVTISIATATPWDSSAIFLWWVAVGPLVVGIHAAYRVFRHDALQHQKLFENAQTPF